MTRRSKRDAASVRLEMMPMIDVTFQLIAFFLFVLNFSRDAIDERIRLPIADQARPVESLTEEPLFLNIDRDGFLLAMGERWHVERDFNKIEAYLKREAAFTRLEMAATARHDPNSDAAKALKEGRLSAVVVLRADRSTPYGPIRRLIELCQRVGFYRFALRAKERQE